MEPVLYHFDPLHIRRNFALPHCIAAAGSHLPKSHHLLGWIFNVGYLLVAYYIVNDTTGYVLNWTSAQCVLTLRCVCHDGCNNMGA